MCIYMYFQLICLTPKFKKPQTTKHNLVIIICFEMTINGPVLSDAHVIDSQKKIDLIRPMFCCCFFIESAPR